MSLQFYFDRDAKCQRLDISLESASSLWGSAQFWASTERSNGEIYASELRAQTRRRLAQAIRSHSSLFVHALRVAFICELEENKSKDPELAE